MLLGPRLAFAEPSRAFVGTTAVEGTRSPSSSSLPEPEAAAASVSAASHSQAPATSGASAGLRVAHQHARDGAPARGEKRVSPTRESFVFPDLGVVRYRDPSYSRELWLGVDVGGIVIPEAVGLFNRTVWTAHMSPAWALALLPRVALGGRHGLVWYDAQNVRVRVHQHQLDLSARLLRRKPKMRDRLALSFEVHRLMKMHVIRADGTGFEPFSIGGVQDVVLGLGYGIEHRLSARWAIDWNVQGRFAWVMADTQRHARASLRMVFWPKRGHQLIAEAVGFLVHRDELQQGAEIARTSIHGQFACEYLWMSRHRVGVVVRARAATSYLSGEAPFYEAREEALRNAYGEAVLGMRFVWR